MGKIRKPKAEGRTKTEVRNPNEHRRARLCSPIIIPADGAVREAPGVSHFGFRHSAFLRPLLFTLSAQSALAAATNSTDLPPIPPLRPPHAELPPTFWEQHGLWVILLGVLVLLLLGTVIWFVLRSRPPVLVPPEVQARRALEPLRQKPEDGALLSQVSQVLRHYIAAAFNLPPQELTTTEFCRAVAADTRLGPELSTALADFLCQCDQRKFSPPAPAPPLSAVAHALKLIDQAQARLAALAVPAAPPKPEIVR